MDIVCIGYENEATKMVPRRLLPYYPVTQIIRLTTHKYLPRCLARYLTSYERIIRSIDVPTSVLGRL